MCVLYECGRAVYSANDSVHENADEGRIERWCTARKPRIVQRQWVDAAGYVSRLVEPLHSLSETNTRHAGSADHGWTLLPHQKSGHCFHTSNLDAAPTPEIWTLFPHQQSGHCFHTRNPDAINLARDSSVIMLSFLPETIHRLQPLDVSFFRPLSIYYSQATGPCQHILLSSYLFTLLL